MKIMRRKRTAFLEMVLEKYARILNVEELDEETTRMTERMVVLRVSTKHINLWIRQLEMKRREMIELAGLMKFEEVKKEIGNEINIERWAKKTTNHFTKKAKRMLFEEIDNMVWNNNQEVTKWCERNKMYDVISEAEIEEIWQREQPDDGEAIRLNGKYVWETAKRVCDFINTHEDLIHITTFGEYRDVMKNVMRVIKEAHNAQRK